VCDTSRDVRDTSRDVRDGRSDQDPQREFTFGAAITVEYHKIKLLRRCDGRERVGESELNCFLYVLKFLYNVNVLFLIVKQWKEVKTSSGNSPSQLFLSNQKTEINKFKLNIVTNLFLSSEHFIVPLISNQAVLSRSQFSFI